MTPTNKKLLALLKQNARLSNTELSTMLGISEQEVAAGIKELEASGIIIGYAAIVNEEKADDNAVFFSVPKYDIQDNNQRIFPIFVDTNIGCGST